MDTLSSPPAIVIDSPSHAAGRTTAASAESSTEEEETSARAEAEAEEEAEGSAEDVEATAGQPFSLFPLPADARILASCGCLGWKAVLHVRRMC